MMTVIIRMIAILLLVLLLMLSFLVSCSWPFAPGSLVLAWATELPRATQVLTYNSPPEKFHPISFSFFSVSVADFSALEEGEITAEFFVWRGAKPLRNFRLPGRETTPAQPPRNFPRNFSRNFFLYCFGLFWNQKKFREKFRGKFRKEFRAPRRGKIPQWFRPSTNEKFRSVFASLSGRTILQAKPWTNLKKIKKKICAVALVSSRG